MKTLKKFEFASRTESTYPWEKILDGGIYELKEGEDFKCKVATFSTLCRTQASKMHKTVKIGNVEGGIVVQATKMTDEQIAEHDAKVEQRKQEKAAEKAAGDQTTEAAA